MSGKIRFIDLFAGAGGFHFAMGDKDNECVFASEKDEYARMTYEANFEVANFHRDITTLDVQTVPDHDLLLGGFPCQPFSLAGKQLGFKHATQGTLFKNIADILDAKKPASFLLENVKNLKSHDNGNTYKTIYHTLREVGYHVDGCILNATEFGLPQNRERVYLVGFRNEDSFESFCFPRSDTSVKKKLFGDIINIKIPVEDKYYQEDMSSPSIEKMHNGFKNESGVVKKNVIYQYRRFYMRQNQNRVCPTLTANMGCGGHNVPLILDDRGIRKLTPRECFSIQGFPLDMKFPKGMADSHLYKQAGNAIPVPVVNKILNRIKEILQR